MPRPAREMTRRKSAHTARGNDRTAQAAASALSVPSDAKLYINRELSLLESFRRVLEEAQDENNPLLERVKFLSIAGSILAEFFMVRVAGLKQQIEAGVVELSIDGLTPAQQLAAVRQVAAQLMAEERKCLQDLLPQLAQAGIRILDYGALDETQKAAANDYFHQVIFPILTPLAVDPGRPFPHISNMSLNLAILIRDEFGDERFARLKVPNSLPRLLEVTPPPDTPKPDGRVPMPQHFVWLDQVIAANLNYLFPGMQVIEDYLFRVTRDAEMVIQELEAHDLLIKTIEHGVRQRRFGSVVRVTIDHRTPAYIRDILVENLELDPDAIYTLDPPLGMSDLNHLYSLERHDLKDPPFVPAVPTELAKDADIFAAIRRRDILLHHPYDSFSPVLDFLRAAAHDPNVLAIKMTLYRVGRNSPVVEALLEAAGKGKQVAVLVEIKARFDEESNIEWARSLESEGVHVVYGLLGLKTHSKIALVVRKEGDGIRRYVHLSTGNYNPITAQSYTDIGLLTCDEGFGADASGLFNYLTGYSAKKDYGKFLVAPINLRAGLKALIEREIECQRNGEQGHLIFKLNSLVDKPLMQLLYQASQAGVKVDLVVRSICCLRPGLEGLSENIRVTSIVGRFLEHSRIYYFRNGGHEEIYLGSADLMPRNLDRRVEILFPVHDPRHVRELRDQVLATYLADNVKARLLRPDGTYQRVRPAPGETPLDSQAWFIRQRALEAEDEVGAYETLLPASRLSRQPA